MVVWPERRLRCMAGGVAADMRIYYILQILHLKINYFIIYECKNVMDVII